MSAVSLAREFWRRMATNDFASIAPILADDFVAEWPQSRERIRGAQAYVRINAEYPANGPWRFTVHRVVGDEREAVTDVSFTDGVQFARVISFLTVEAGRVTRLIEYFPEPYEPPANRSHLTERIMTRRATGTFDVKLAPLALHEAGALPGLGRMSIDKTIHGDLEATTHGEMLSAMTDTKGSAGYVAIERVSGRLDGREGTFVFQHSSTMARGVPRQSITVVPDSGTGALAGLEGTFTIDIREGKHFYVFEYSLGES